MSNPNRAPNEPLNARQTFLARMPVTYLQPPEQWEDTKRSARNIPVIQGGLANLRMRTRNTIVLRRRLCADPQIMKMEKDPLLNCGHGAPKLSIRSSNAVEVALAFYDQLTPTLRTPIDIACKDSVYAVAGAEFCIGRLMTSYPRRGTALDKSIVPITAEEAQLALDNTGCRVSTLPPGIVQAYPLEIQEGEISKLKINPKSSNGSPTFGKWEDTDARRQCMKTAYELSTELVNATDEGGYPAVFAWKAGLEKTEPDLVAVMGKCKADHYKPEKLYKKEMRWFNVIPRWASLIMQTVTQPFEAAKRNILMGESHNAQGITLAHGGANKLMHELDYQLGVNGYGYATCGDDTIMLIRLPDGRILILCTDFSAFDLSQRAVVIHESVKALHGEIASIGAAAAHLWRAYTTSRLTVVAGTNVRLLEDAMPSGLPGGSTLNAQVCDVYCQRVIRGVRALTGTDEEIRDEVWLVTEAVAKSMSLKVKIEHLRVVDAVSSLSTGFTPDQDPISFIGYQLYFNGKRGKYYPYMVIPRAMSRIPFPHLWVDKKVFDTTEAIRVAGTVMNLGVPPVHYMDAHLAMVNASVKLIDDVLNTVSHKAAPRDDPEQMKWMLDTPVVGFTPLEPTLLGMRKALLQPLSLIWGPNADFDTRLASQVEARRTMPHAYGVAGFDPVRDGSAWADEEDTLMTSQMVELREAYGLPVAPLEVAVLTHVRKFVHRSIVPPMRSASERNDGRPPPVAAWGPNKAPRPKKQPMRRGTHPVHGPRQNDRLYQGMIDQEDQHDREHGSDFEAQEAEEGGSVDQTQAEDYYNDVGW